MLTLDFINEGQFSFVFFYTFPFVSRSHEVVVEQLLISSCADSSLAAPV